MKKVENNINPKSEILNPKSRLAGSRKTLLYDNKEAGQILITKIRNSKRFEKFGFGILDLFRISSLEFRVFRFLVCVFYFWSLISGFSFASAKEYDGIWFLGFNLSHRLLQNLQVRKAAIHALDKNYIATEIMSEEVAAGSIIPPGMLGYDSNLPAVGKDLAYAKFLMKQAGYSITSPALKRLSLLHTDGIKTIAIAKTIKNNLAQIGMKVNLTEVSYRDEKKWSRELSSGKYDFFLMGYKANPEQLFTAEATAQDADAFSLLEPLFKTRGSANFTFYSNTKVDRLLGQLSYLDPSLKKERAEKLEEINEILYQDVPVVVLFYIEKL